MNRRRALKTLALSAGAAVAARGGMIAADRALVQARDPVAAPRDTARAGAAPAGPFTLPPLPYAYDALEPHLDARTMQIHHDLHHAAYVANLNKAVAGKPELEAMTLEQMLRGLDKVPEAVRTAVRNHGGGHANHSLLWTNLSPGASREPRGELAEAIQKMFGSFSAFQDRLSQVATTVFGSGWAWLSLDEKSALRLEWTQNQDSPLMVGRQPLLGVDVWEHAYYLKFQNRRAEYLAEFAKVVNWDAVSARYDELKKKG